MGVLAARELPLRPRLVSGDLELSATQVAGDATRSTTPTADAWSRLVAILDRPELVFALLATIIGVTFALVTPPLVGADERDQFERAFMISEGQVFATWHGTHVGGTFPATLERELDAIAHRVYSDPDRNGFLHLLSRPAPSGPPRFGDVGLFASYGPGAYIPAAVGIDAGRLFGGSALVLVYLARLFQLLAYVAIVTLAVRRLPSHRWVMVVSGLIPAALFQAATVSADTLTIALSFLVVAETLRITCSAPEAVRRPMLVETAIAALALALCKPPYVAFVLLLVVPALRHGRVLLKPLTAVAGSALLLSAAWSAYSVGNTIDQDDPSRFVVPPRLIYHHAYQGLDQGGQIRHALTHPWDFGAAIVETGHVYGMKLLEWVWGLSAFEIPLVLTILTVLVLAMATVLPTTRPEPDLPGATRALLIALSLGIGLAILLYAYAAWNQYRAPYIENVPGRYWLPLVPALLVGLAPRARVTTRGFAAGGRVLVAALMAGVLVATVAVLIDHHYRGRPPLAATSSARSATLPR
jgi:uncharacterized membrane protein